MISAFGVDHGDVVAKGDKAHGARVGALTGAGVTGAGTATMAAFTRLNPKMTAIVGVPAAVAGAGVGAASGAMAGRSVGRKKKVQGAQ